MRTKAKSLCTALGLAGALYHGGALAAVDNASCCLQATSKVDALLNPVSGGDEKFFTSGGRPANILIVLDTSGSMHAWPQDWPETTGCSHPEITSLGYNPATVYPRMWKDLNNRNDDWFDTDKFYEAPDNGYGVNFNGSPSGSTWNDANSACDDVSNEPLCRTCLASEGYYVDSDDEEGRRVTGNFLNFYAPRDSGAVHVLTQIAHDVRNVRFGVQVFKKSSSSGCGYSGNCLCMFEPMGPNCNKSYPLDASFVDNQRTNILANLRNSLGWSGCGTPLSNALYLAGVSLASVSPTGIPAGWPRPAPFQEGSSLDQRAICFECGLSAIIVLTDGEPNSDTLLTIPTEITSLTTAPCPAPCTSNPMPKVAKWFYQTDIRADADMPGAQKVMTYTIGFSVDAANSNLLMLTGLEGGGTRPPAGRPALSAVDNTHFYPAVSSSQLKDAFKSIIEDVLARNTSFSSGSIASLQTGNSMTSAVLPRMRPHATLPWKGELYRFRLYNEFVEEADLDGDTAGTPGYQSEIFVLDRNDARVAEDPDGNFVVRGTSTPAVPYWEAAARLRTVITHANRNIYTVIDTGDGALTDSDPMYPFTVANASTLMKYLGIVGTGQTYCPVLGVSDGTLLTKWGLTLAAAACNPAIVPNCAQAVPNVTSTYPATQAAADQLCAELLIAYVRGQDVADEDADGNRGETRPSVLGDIFHSSPTTVEPPQDRFLCDLALSTQCVRTLYSSDGIIPTPLTTYSETDPCRGAVTRNAYESYVARWRRRDRLVVTGTNDGMLHAFQNGHFTSEVCSDGLPIVTWDEGTGDEVWAVIPPDQLAKLADGVLKHGYSVDGDIMVRDIWADTTLNPGAKDASEFHTLIVAAEGRGGNHYFALEANFDPDTGLALSPTFRWMFPQPCSPESMNVGKALFALSPKPPPVGPVLLAASAGNPVRLGQPTEERWVVMVGGGWSPALEKGRGVYMLDAWNGMLPGRTDNLLWKAEFDEAAAGERFSPLKEMHHSVTAPVAMVDYGTNTAFGQDGFFDTAVVGDTAGRLWVMRMSAPGVLSPTTRLMDNWTIARGFDQDRAGGASFRNRWPFFYLPSIGLQPETRAMRAFIGTGNRYSILDTSAGTCRYDNPHACAKYDCSQVKIVSTLNRLDRNITKEETHWGSQAFTHGKHEESPALGTACGASGTPSVVGTIQTSQVDGCPGVPGSLYGDVRNRTVQCVQDASANFSCARTDANVNNITDLVVSPTNPIMSSLGRNRFYGVWIYGGPPARTFDETATSGLATANQFDGRRLTDRSGTNPTAGDLVDVSGTTCDVTGTCSGNQATESGWGWLLDYPDRTGWSKPYPDLEHKTASGAGLVASCVLFSEMYPQATSSSSACTTGGVAKSRLYQADYLTGAPNCAFGFRTPAGYQRYMERDVVAPPPEPSMVVQISRSGKLRYSQLLLEPGSDQVTQADVSGTTDALKAIYELPVSRELHECRHTPGGKAAGACVPSE